MLIYIHTVVDGESRVGGVSPAVARELYAAKLVSLRDGIATPQECIEFATDWHNGQSSMLYAVASSSGLRCGNGGWAGANRRNPIH